MSDQVRNQNVGFHMMRLICLTSITQKTDGTDKGILEGTDVVLQYSMIDVSGANIM